MLRLSSKRSIKYVHISIEVFIYCLLKFLFTFYWSSNSWFFRILAIFQNSDFCKVSHFSIIHNYLIKFLFRIQIGCWKSYFLLLWAYYSSPYQHAGFQCLFQTWSKFWSYLIILLKDCFEAQFVAKSAKNLLNWVRSFKDWLLFVNSVPNFLARPYVLQNVKNFFEHFQFQHKNKLIFNTIGFTQLLLDNMHT